MKNAIHSILRQPLSCSATLALVWFSGCGGTSSSSLREQSIASRIFLGLMANGNSSAMSISVPATATKAIICETATPAECKPGAAGYASATESGVRGDQKLFVTAAPLSIRSGLSLSVLAIDANSNVIEAVQVAFRDKSSGTMESALASLQLADLSKVVYSLASPELGGRRAGWSSGSKLAKDMVIKSFQDSGLQPGVNGQWLQRFSQGDNVIGVLPGNDPTLKNEAIVIGGHLDHLGACNGGICLGADDNASGTAGVLAVARAAGAMKSQNKRTLIFIAFDAEEEGLIGSQAYVENPIMPMSQTVYMINMDMIGYVRQNGRLLALGGKSSATAASLITQLAKKYPNLGTPALSGQAGGGSDHESFASAGIPHVFFHSGTDVSPYHRPQDTPDKLDYAGVTSVAKLAFELAFTLSQNPARPGSSNGPAAVGSTNEYPSFGLRVGTPRVNLVNHGVTAEIQAELNGIQ